MTSLPRTVPPARTLVFAAAALAAALVGTHAAGAQTTSTCLPLDDAALVLRSYLREIVTTTDPARVALRTDLGLAAMDSTRVTLVTDNRVCAKVAQGINTALKTPNLVRQLYVFSVGRPYAAQDPGHPSGQYQPTMVVNAQYTLVGSVLAP